MPTEFVPEECSALAIQACIAAKQCFLDEQRLGVFEKKTSSGTQKIGSAHAELGGQDSSLLAAVAAAYAEHGCPMPPLPATPPAPDLSPCTAELAALKARAADPLAFLEGIIEIVFDNAGKPTLIRVL